MTNLTDSYFKRKKNPQIRTAGEPKQREEGARKLPHSYSFTSPELILPSGLGIFILCCDTPVQRIIRPIAMRFI